MASLTKDKREWETISRRRKPLSTCESGNCNSQSSFSNRCNSSPPSGSLLRMLQSDAARRIREARWKQGLSRREVSERTTPTVSEATIVKVESSDKPGADYTPLPQTIYILAAALDLDVDSLFAAPEPEAVNE